MADGIWTMSVNKKIGSKGGCRESAVGENGDKPSPMLNSVILKQIFEWITASNDFANFRLVCSRWNEESLREWRASASVTILQRRLKEDSTVGLEDKNELDIDDFCDLFKNNELKLESFPFKSYKFKCWDLDEFTTEPSSESLRYFWDKVGPHIKTLHFEECISTHLGSPGFQAIVFRELTENLTELKLSRNSFRLPLPNHPEESIEWMKGIQQRLLDTNCLLKLRKLDLSGSTPTEFIRLMGYTFPNLEVLRLNDHDLSDNELQKLYHKWWAFLNNCKMIKELDVMDFGMRLLSSGSSVRAFVEALTLPRLKFQSLCLEIPFSTWTWTEVDFQNLLRNHKDILKVLKLYKKYSHSHPPFSRFPFLVEYGSLEELYLWGHIAGDFRFLQCMPQLKRVVICRNNTEDVVISNEKNLAPFNYQDMVKGAEANWDMSGVCMQHLHYLNVNLLFESESLKKLREWLPHLKTLKIIARNAELKIISEQWPELSELELLPGSEDVNDDGISSFLTSFTQLGSFSLLLRNCCQGRLTAESVHKGFLQIPSLHILKLCVSSKMSAAAEELLKKKLFSATIVRNHGVCGWDF